MIDFDFINGKYKTASDFETTDVEYIRLIENITDNIIKTKDEKPIILLSGPSGSGKTTTAYFIEAALDKKGYETHTVSLDNYLKTILPDERLKLDYESPDRIDAELLTDHIEKLIKCEEIDVPSFDFANTRRNGYLTKIKRKKNELIIFEGIHALNPDTVRIDCEKSFRIYVSVTTRITDGSEIFQPEYVRLLRRMCRDKLYRGRMPSETLRFFESVEEGRKKFIAPYKSRANAMIDSFIGYELGVYKSLLARDLEDMRNIDSDGENDGVLRSLFGMIGSVEALNPDDVPENSLIREFIG